jgi:hypothetical protein
VVILSLESSIVLQASCSGDQPTAFAIMDWEKASQQAGSLLIQG